MNFTLKNIKKNLFIPFDSLFLDRIFDQILVLGQLLRVCLSLSLCRSYLSILFLLGLVGRYNEFIKELIDYNSKDDQNSDDLPGMCFMVVEYQAYTYCEHFSGCYDKGDDMLLECFDHAVNDKVTQACQDAQADQVECEQFVRKGEV